MSERRKKRNLLEGDALLSDDEIRKGHERTIMMNLSRCSVEQLKSLSAIVDIAADEFSRK